MKRGGSGYDTDFQAWLDYNSAQGHYMTSDTVKLAAANQYVIDSKADGTWDGKDVFHLFAWNDLQMDDASLVCLKRLIKVDVYGGMTYTLNGWEGNKVDGYIDPLFNPSTNGVNYTLDDAGIGLLVYKSKSSGLGELIGVADSIGVETIYNTSHSSQRINSYVTALNSSADLSGIGLKSVYRDDSTNVRLYNKGVENLRTANSHGSSMNYNRLLLQRGNSNYSDIGLSAFYFSASLTQSQNESIRTNFNTYLSTIGLTPIA